MEFPPLPNPLPARASQGEGEKPAVANGLVGRWVPGRNAEFHWPGIGQKRSGGDIPAFTGIIGLATTRHG